MIQVSIGSRAIQYNLEKQEPNALCEVPAMNHLIDCQNYVETGCTM